MASKSRAEKLLKKIERTLCRGSTFHYHSDNCINECIKRIQNVELTKE